MELLLIISKFKSSIMLKPQWQTDVVSNLNYLEDIN